MELYLVRPGDTLAALACRCGSTAEALAAMNQLGDPRRLLPGQTLLLPGGETPARQEILVNAYLRPGVNRTVLCQTLPALSLVSPFSRRLGAAGELCGTDGAALAAEARRAGAAPLLTVSNLAESGGFSSDLAHALFTDSAFQDRALAQILQALDEAPWAGVNLHLAYVYPFDRDGYNCFLRRLSERLHERGRYLVTALAPKENAWQEGLLYSAHDYAAHGRWADWVVLMTYDWGYRCSAPQAVSPVDRIRRTLDYALTQMPASSVLLGFSNYGYRWRLPWRQGDEAVTISNSAALALAVADGAALRFDKAAQAPWFTCRDGLGRRSVVWFEDLRSAAARFRLVGEYGLAGLSWWTADRPFLPALLLQQSLFDVARLL